ncbi:unnamed protein product [Caenorhabditis bovis]|uniref:U3 small nucleolar RNA-associated protein 25 homolog n=1 Tax=Caenorhabditis bovis TaxID=2654633 RepID=A0A8S1ECR6_9PELO|nr:unnamed protein product [Caenorhabditis bovis]
MSGLKKLRKRAATSKNDEEALKEAKIEQDKFSSFFNVDIDSVASAKLKDIKERTKKSKKLELPGLGNSVFYQGLHQMPSSSSSALDASKIGWNSSLFDNLTSILELDASRRTFVEIISNYLDFQAISDDQNGYRAIYCAHIVAHLISNKNLIIGNKKKLEMANAASGASEQLIESCRDTGFVRPTVLILCAFKKDAYDIVHKLIRLIYGEDEGDVWNKNRFEDEYSGPSEPPPSRVDFPKDHLELLVGNNDDAFRIGVALSKKSLKLFEKFEKADILLCSPLGLRMILNGDDGNEAHLLSSMNIVVVDRADLMLQQNWENVQLIFSQLNTQPAKIDTDISRLLVFARYSHELFTSLTMQNSENHRGLVMSKPKQQGTLKNIEIPLCQEIHKFEVRDVGELSDIRFKYFADKIISTLVPRTLIVIPSYFDFVRIRNHFKRADESFVSCNEYASRSKIDRAREMFFHQRKSYLLVTERWYFFNRRQLTGVHRVVFYQLPSHPLFYSEFINMSEADTSQRLLAVLLVCKYDRIRMENTFGTEMTAAILNNKMSVQAIVSE